MALPRLLQKLFQNGGAGPRLLKAIMPVGVVFSVNGSSPDADGDVSVSIPTYTHPSTHPASMITGLATVATSGSYNDLSDKPTIPATPKAYVTETWKSGTSWYRKWSDGWIEQGGIANTGANAKGANITLPVGFSNKTYSITASVAHLDAPKANAASVYVEVVKVTTTSFNASGGWAMDGGQNYAINRFCWYACGY